MTYILMFCIAVKSQWKKVLPGDNFLADFPEKSYIKEK